MDMEQLEGSALESLEEDLSEDVSESGSDFEVQLKSKKRMKQTVAHGTLPPKRPRRNVSDQSSSSLTPPASSFSPVQKGPRRASRQQRGRAGGEEESGKEHTTAGSLYEAVSSGRSALVTVVSEWLEDYKQDREAGLLELINFLVQCCGCKGVVSKEMLTSMQNSDIICQLTKEFKEDSAAYPLSSVGPQWRRFRESLCEFVAQLVRRCQHSLLYDDFLFSTLVPLLTGLADSQVRAFRHTSTFIAMKLMSVVVEVAVSVFAQIQVTKRRCELEKSKASELRATQKLEELEQSHSELLEHQTELCSIMNAIFKGVFVHRYRDRVPEIRAVCMEELGGWVLTNSSVFLNDGYLKYLGWMLHDKQPVVRLRCVKALQRLHEEKDFIGRLELFTSRFKERILNMVLDKDAEVAVEAVKLLLLIHKNSEDGLSDEECTQVYPLVFATHKGLASAAGSFLYHILYTEVDKIVEEVGAEKRHETFLNLLTNFFIQSKYHEHGEYILDSLWDVAGTELRDWDTMTSMLLQERDEEEALGDDEEAALIELMICAVRQAAEATPPVGRTQGKKNLSMKDKKIQTQDRRRITTHFTPLLPQLLAKYSADVGKVRCLLRTPLYFDLSTYSRNDHAEKSVDRLLCQVCEIVEKHTEESVLRECARLASALSSEPYAFSTRAHRAFSQMLDQQVERLSAVHNDLLQGTADEDEVYTAASSLKRISIFSSCMDLSSWRLFDPCFALLKTGVQSMGFDKELMVPALKCTAFHLLWERKKISDTDSPTTNKAEVKRLKKEVRSFCIVCQSCLSLGHTQVRDQAFMLLCDVLTVFSVGSVKGRPELKHLALVPDDSLRSEMASFVLDYVFTEPDDEDSNSGEEENLEGEVGKITSLQRRRSQLAAYCRLILCGVLELNAAADIFKYYNKFNRDYGDIIKETLRKSKIISPVECAKTVCLSLQQMFSALGDEQHTRQEFVELREVARRHAMSFGINLHLIRKPLLTFHQDGIRFALRGGGGGEGSASPPNLAFLEVLSEFSFKLMRQDRQQLLEYLKQVSASIRSQWLKMYERSLQSGAARGPGDPPSSRTASPRAKRPRRSSRPGSVRSVTESSLLGDSSISQLATPMLTSTVQRKGAGLQGLQPSERDSASAGSIGAYSPDRESLQPAEQPTSERENESEDDFEESSLQRKTVSSRKRQAQGSSSVSGDISSQLDLLSLIEEDKDEDENQEPDEEEEEEEPEIEEFDEESDDDMSMALPTNRYSSHSSHSRCPSLLEELFD
ncbi:cohesin subunit SA-1 [Sardina pilchardus]|uniref:cohesin subunit SA-1 n=1 Tax=Sardina pilchardus TaxID=27697 RepID=UPI002E0FDE51